MSMSTLMIIRFIEIFICYSAVTLLLPFLVFKNRFANESVAKQFLLYFTIGNFYIINLVLVLQLIHISNFFTLLLFSCILPLLYWSRLNAISLRNKFSSWSQRQKRMLTGYLGWKTIALKNLKNFKQWLYRICRVLYHKMIEKPFQWFLLLSISFFLIWIYGRQLYFVYGYCASDIPVHMDWINQMSRGIIFARGVYPFGFHCVIYYLHTVFHFDVYVLMCTFYFVQCIYIHLLLLATLKGICKTKYMPYFGILCYIVPDIWTAQTYSRFSASLPQEFGMMFIMPSIYFLIEFFKTTKEGLKTYSNKWVCIGFAMAFSLTLAIHFYGTMIAGLCCVGIGLGYFYRFVRKEYFVKIMITGILSVMSAVLPMAIAYATGTPLQGSLGWGMNVLKGISSDDSSSSTSVDDDGNTVIKDGNTTTVIINQDNSNTENSQGTNIAKPKKERKPTFKERLVSLYKSMLNIMSRSLFNEKYLKQSLLFSKVILFSGVACFCFGLIFVLFRSVDYGSTCFSISFSMLFLTLLLCSSILPFPSLMDETRCSIYYVYIYILCISMCLDGLFNAFMFPKRIRWLRNFLSFVVCLILISGLVSTNRIKERNYKSSFVTNGAYTCLTNIIKENTDYNWTIVSANDETQMGLDHGWHYELISFLHTMQYMKKSTKINIPTENVYFFIEKIPLDYNEPYLDSGQTISKKGALQKLPSGGGISMYKGEYRWVVMSKMYQWAQAFQKKYPNDLMIYYEDNQFVCYKIKQNTYDLINFAIDYGYNQ